MDNRGAKIDSLIKCKFTDNTKWVVSLFSAAGRVTDVIAGSLRASGKMPDIYALTARNVNRGGAVIVSISYTSYT